LGLVVGMDKPKDNQTPADGDPKFNVHGSADTDSNTETSNPNTTTDRQS
jgi:hypothetical protein